jgi:phosphatidylglycerol---prolipoprotein diacylglyceryl transferase
VRRILVEWRGLKLYAYPVMLYVGTLTGALAGTYAASRLGLNPLRAYAALLLLFPLALIGSRLLFILAHWRFYCQEPGRFWRQSEGGASLYGGLILAFLVSLPLLKILGLRFGAFWDAACVMILVGMMFTKVGCLLTGCCAGRPTKGRLAMYLPDIRGVWRRRVPAQLLEAGLAALILVGLLGLWKQFPFEGAGFLGALAAYAGGRWWLESAGEDIEVLGSISLHQTISVGLLAAAIASFWLLWPRTP